MKKDEIVEKLKQNMPKFKGEDEEREIKTALYVYIELAKMKSFDERYYFGNREQMKKAYQESVIDSKNPDEVAKKRKITCVSLSNLYKAVLADFGIKSEAIKENVEDDHVFTKIKLKNKKEIIADIQRDMHNIHTKSRLKHFQFSQIEEDKISPEQLTQMLIEIGYIENEEDYRDKKIEKVQEQVKGLSPYQALDTILKNEYVIEGTEGIGVVEAHRYYNAILKQIIPKYINKNIFKFQCKKANKESENSSYTICIYAEEKEQEKVKPYLFSEKNSRFLECDLKTLDKLQKEGLVLGKTGKENGVRKLKKYIKKEQEKNEQQL